MADQVGRDEFYQAMVRQALGLYDDGLTPVRVLRECYGVEFPPEVFAIAGILPLPDGIPDWYTDLPWQLAVPPEPGSPPWETHFVYLVEREVRSRDSDLVPLVALHDPRAEHGGLRLCYRVSELAAGRSTVFGVPDEDEDEPVQRVGDSLISVLLYYYEEMATQPGQHAEWAAAAGQVLDRLGEVHRGLGPPVKSVAPERVPLDTLRTRASRADYHSLAVLARALYAEGLGPREVLRECYGVDFPAEFFVVADGDIARRLSSDFDLPWQLTIPLDRGGPFLRPVSGWRLGRRFLDRFPDLVPLVSLHSDFRWGHGGIVPPPPARHGGRIVCYSLGELAARRSTVWGVSEKVDDAQVCGESLLSVLHEHYLDRYRLDEWESRQPWSWGADTIRPETIEEGRRLVESIEAMQRKAGLDR